MWICRCHTLLSFEHFECPTCGIEVVYDPELTLMRPALDSDSRQRCANRAFCNWLTPVNDALPGAQALCMACQLTRIVPPLDSDERLRARQRFERAKRRLAAGLLRLKLLPRYLRRGDYHLEINLKEDRRSNPAVFEEMVMTGHSMGVITINSLETDSVKQEEARQQFNEKYRTLLGTMRHEVGHYFWYVLIDGRDQRLAAFRACFGDERDDYASALERHYQREPVPESHDDFITDYASAHAHEDWAEIWAHMLHLEDTLTTAISANIMLPTPDEARDDFATQNAQWRRIATVANSLSASLGHPRAYPFRHTPAVQEKLRFVFELIHHHAKNGGPPSEPPAIAEPLGVA